MTGPRIGLTFQGPHQPTLFIETVEATSGGAEPDAYYLEIPDDQRRRDGRWREAMRGARREIGLAWGMRGEWTTPPPDLFVWWHVRHAIVGFQVPYSVPDPGAYLARVAPLPFTTCATQSLHNEWWTGPLRSRYRRMGFADSHFGHGWMCAFKGAGHDRLVSRRWLDHGPWRVLRDEARDVSLVQFHDVEADAETALDQAMPGHARMGISDTGGFIQSPPWTFKAFTPSEYDPATRTVRVFVEGRDPSQRELLEAAIHRSYHHKDRHRPVDRVAYVFLEPRAAEAHLHDLWLREIECHALTDSGTVRLDADYTPPAHEPPEWVRRLEAAAP